MTLYGLEYGLTNFCFYAFWYSNVNIEIVFFSSIQCRSLLWYMYSTEHDCMSKHMHRILFSFSLLHAPTGLIRARNKP